MLNTALDGGGTDWDRLHEICSDRARAEALARMLEQQATDENDTAVAWAQMLAELHPGLKVTLPPARPPSS